MTHPIAHRAAAIAAAVSLSLAAATAAAEDPFRLRAETTSGTPASATAVGSDLIDLVDNLVDSQDAFLTLAGRDVTASLTYGGIENAILVDRSADGSSATITLPTTGFTRTFTGADANDVEGQIEDFLLSEGAAEYAKFLRTINEQSPIGVVDGNPLAGTALLAENVFNRFGLYRGAMAPQSNIIRHGSGTSLSLTGGTSDTDFGGGTFANLSMGQLIRFGSRVGLSFGPTLTYRQVEDADVYHIGGHIALPIIFIAPGEGAQGVIWQLTPAFMSGASGSTDLAAGGTLLGGGVTSSIRVPLGERLGLDIANQISFFEGFPIDIGDYEFETDLSQQILKNGVRLSYLFADNIYVDGSLTHTKFLEDAAVEDYLSPGAGVGFYFSDRHTSGVRLAYQANIADELDSHAGSVQLYFNY